MPEQQELNKEIITATSTDSEKFPGVKAAIVRQMLAASDEMNVERSLKFCTDDVRYKFGNLPVVVGKQGIKESSTSFLQNFKSLKHDVQNIWEIGEVVVVEMEINYIRHDDKRFNLPCCNIFTMKGDLVREMKIYMDISPVFA